MCGLQGERPWHKWRARFGVERQDMFRNQWVQLSIEPRRMVKTVQLICPQTCQAVDDASGHDFMAAENFRVVIKQECFSGHAIFLTVTHYFEQEVCGRPVEGACYWGQWNSESDFRKMHELGSVLPMFNGIRCSSGRF